MCIDILERVEVHTRVTMPGATVDPDTIASRCAFLLPFSIGAFAAFHALAFQELLQTLDEVVEPNYVGQACSLYTMLGSHSV